MLFQQIPTILDQCVVEHRIDDPVPWMHQYYFHFHCSIGIELAAMVSYHDVLACNSNFDFNDFIWIIIITELNAFTQRTVNFLHNVYNK